MWYNGYNAGVSTKVVFVAKHDEVLQIFNFYFIRVGTMPPTHAGMSRLSRY